MNDGKGIAFPCFHSFRDFIQLIRTYFKKGKHYSLHMNSLGQILEKLERLEDLALQIRSPWYTVRHPVKCLKMSERSVRRLIASNMLKSHLSPEGGHRLHKRIWMAWYYLGSSIVSSQTRSFRRS